MSFLSSDLQAKVQTTVASLNFETPLSVDVFNTFFTSVTSLHAEVAAEVATAAAAAVAVVAPVEAPVEEPVAKPKRKATTTKQKAVVVAPTLSIVSSPVTEESLLKPVEMKSTATTNASLVPITDPYSGHKYRLAAYDPTLCVGRRVDEKVVIPGTDPKDAEANGKIFAEKQCSKSPMPGQSLCKICCEKDDAVKKDPSKNDKRWNGRLDEPMFDRAYVIGSNHFFKKYPNGLPNDPTTAPVATTAASAPKPVVASAPKTSVIVPVVSAVPTNTIVETKTVKEKKPRGGKKVTADVSDTKASVAVDVAPVVPEFVTFLCDSDGTGKKLHIRIVSNGKTYKADSSKKTPQEMVIRDKYVGRWQNDALNVNAAESDDDE